MIDIPAPRIWRSPGPVSTAFMSSMADVQGINGPVGGGKTSTMLIKSLKLAHMQAPNAQGVRKTRWTTVRQDYRRMWSSTIPSWWHWRPKELGDWNGGVGEPASHHLQLGPLPDGTEVDYILDFIAIGDKKAEEVLRGYEPTGFLLNEADLLDPEVLEYALTRTGRYPKMEDGGPSWHGVLMDFNAPDEDGYLYEIMTDPPEGYEIFRQPGGLDPSAENLANLPAGYYDRQIKLMRRAWLIDRMVHNKPAASRDGKPVYEEFSDHLHMAGNPLEAVQGLTLGIGADAGRTPAAVIGQEMPNGQIRIIGELVCENMGARRFGEALAKFVRENWPWALENPKLIAAFGDPAAGFAGDQSERTWLQIVSEHSGIRFRAAPVPNNDLTIRLEAVRLPLSRVIDGEPGFLLSPTCKILRRGFLSGYRYRRLQIANSESYEEKPDKKGKYSHPHDGLQYLLVGFGGHHEVLGRKRAQANGVRQTVAATDDAPAEYTGGGGSRQRVAIAD